MASLRQIKQRIRSTQNSKQIMRVMQLVSASKLKRAQSRLLQARETMKFLNGVRQRLIAAMPEGIDHPTTSLRRSAVYATQRRSADHGSADARRWRATTKRWWDHPLCRPQGQGTDALVLLTSDAGLCGSYNANLIQLAEAHLRRDAARATQIVFIGKRGHRYFTKRGCAAAEAYLDLAGRPDLAKAGEIGRALMEAFRAGRFSSVSVLYSRFVSSSVYRPTVEPWLPVIIRPETRDQRLEEDSRLKTQDSKFNQPGPQVSSLRSPVSGLEYIFEPSPQRVFDTLLPRWALAKFQQLMLEALTAEHSARMIAMKNATDNAQELLNTLTTQRNKIRQATITKELSEIVGTAEALK